MSIGEQFGHCTDTPYPGSKGDGGSFIIEEVNHISRESKSTAAKSMDWLQDVQSSQKIVHEL